MYTRVTPIYFRSKRLPITCLYFHFFSLVGYEAALDVKTICDADILIIEQATVEIALNIKQYVTRNTKKAKARQCAIESIFRLIFGDVFGVLMASDPNIAFRFSLGEIALISEISELIREEIVTKKYAVLAPTYQIDKSMLFYASTKQAIIGTLFNGICSCHLVDEMENLGEFIKHGRSFYFKTTQNNQIFTFMLTFLC